MTVDGTPALTPGLFGRVLSGVFGGLAGGVVFGVMMQATGVIPMVAQLVGQESYAIGWTVHMSIAVFVGTTHALIFGMFAVTLSISTVLGAFYGLVWWVLGGLTLMPLQLGLGLFVFDTAAWQSLAGHLAYGVALGVVYAVVAQLLIRADRRPEPEPERRDLSPRALPAAPEAPPPAAPEAPLPAEEHSMLRFVLPSEPPRSTSPAPFGAGLTSLPPQARELRRRHQ